MSTGFSELRDKLCLPQVYWHALTDKTCYDRNPPCKGRISNTVIRKQMYILNKAFAGGYAGELSNVELFASLGSRGKASRYLLTYLTVPTCRQNKRPAQHENSFRPA